MRLGDFPKPVRLTGRAVAWPEGDIKNWLALRKRDGNEATSAGCVKAVLQHMPLTRLR